MAYVSKDSLNKAKLIIQQGGSLAKAEAYLNRQAGGAEAPRPWFDYYINEWNRIAQNEGEPRLTQQQINEANLVYNHTLQLYLTLEEFAEFRAAYELDRENGDFPGPAFSVAVNQYSDAYVGDPLDVLKFWMVDGAMYQRLGIAPPAQNHQEAEDMEL